MTPPEHHLSPSPPSADSRPSRSGSVRSGAPAGRPGGASAEPGRADEAGAAAGAGAGLDLLHLIPYLGRAQGGPVSALATLSGGLVDAGCRVTIACHPRARDGAPPAIPPRVDVIRPRRVLGGRFRWGPGLARRLARGGWSLVHSHGLWTHAGLVADGVARRLAAPHVLAPCGMLQPGALRSGQGRKRLAARLYQDSVLRRAACLQSKSEPELEALRARGLTQPVALLPNPVARPVDVNSAATAAFRRHHGIGEIERLLLFLGRLHPVKGLHRLLEAWAGLGEERRGWRLLLAGPDPGQERIALEARCEAPDLRSSVTFTGELDEVQKWIAFAASDLFVMPSEFESHGLAVAEALTAGLPVVVTSGTPWGGVGAAGCGWVSDAGVGPLRDALAAALRTGEAERGAMGATARRRSRSWSPERVAGAWIAVYRWLLGQGDRPPCVIVD